MIGWLQGTIVHKGLDGIILNVGGVGYELTVSLRDLEQLPLPGSEVALHVHTNVREDAIVLYGFCDEGARRLYREITTVSGIGPKLAMSALGMYPAAELRQIVVAGDVTRLMRISGVGKKTAQRMILELTEKLRGLDLGDLDPNAAPRPSAILGDLASALENLGYSAKAVENVIDTLVPRADAGAPLESLLKEGLALLRS